MKTTDYVGVAAGALLVMGVGWKMTMPNTVAEYASCSAPGVVLGVKNMSFQERNRWGVVVPDGTLPRDFTVSGVTTTAQTGKNFTCKANVMMGNASLGAPNMVFDYSVKPTDDGEDAYLSMWPSR